MYSEELKDALQNFLATSSQQALVSVITGLGMVPDGVSVLAVQTQPTGWVRVTMSLYSWMCRPETGEAVLIG